MSREQPAIKPKPLTARQKVALQLTLDGMPKGQICEHMGITPKTLWNWRRLPGWNETLDVALKDETTDGNAMVKSYYPMAIGILRKLAITGNDSIRLGACRTLVDAHTALVTREEQQVVLTQLEEQIEDLRALAEGRALPEPAIDVETAPIANDSANEAEPVAVVITP